MGKLLVEEGKLRLVRNEQSAIEFSKADASGFATPPTWNIEIPVPPGPAQHQTVTQNFVDAILDGTPLIARAEEGIRSVEIANAMLFSTLTDRTVQLPLDAAAFERALKKLIRASRFQKKADEKILDMKASM
jgi:predicted dehydrogenase